MYSKRRYLNIVSLTTIIFLGYFLNEISAYSKPVNTDEGQAQLMRQINAGQKSNQLTLKEANKLRKDLARVARKKAKLLNKTGRKLSNENKAEIKSDLNEISTEIHKLELDKRVISR